MKKRFLCVFLAVFMLLSSLGAVVFADTIIYYNVAVAGEYVTDQNKGDILGDGTVSYDPESSTLTLKNANINGSKLGEEHCYGIYTYEQNLNVVLYGSNTIQCNTDAANCFGIAVNNANVSISEGESGASLKISCESSTDTAMALGAVCDSDKDLGDVEIKSADVTLSAKGINSAYGIHACRDAKVNSDTKITIGDLSTVSEEYTQNLCVFAAGSYSQKNATTEMASGTGNITYAIYAQKGVTFENSNAKLSSSYGEYSYGILAYEKIELINSNVFAQAGNAVVTSTAVQAEAATDTDIPSNENGTVFVGEGSTLDAIAAKAYFYSIGVMAENLVMNGKKLYAKADTVKPHEDCEIPNSTGIYVNNTFTVNSGQVSAVAGVCENELVYEFSVYSNELKIADDAQVLGVKGGYEKGDAILVPEKSGEPVQIITEEDSVLKGDVNLDKTVNIKDATAIQKHIANMVYLSDISLEATDYNEDGFVNIKDATAIQKMLAGFAE